MAAPPADPGAAEAAGAPGSTRAGEREEDSDCSPSQTAEEASSSALAASHGTALGAAARTDSRRWLERSLDRGIGLADDHDEAADSQSPDADLLDPVGMDSAQSIPLARVPGDGSDDEDMPLGRMSIRMSGSALLGETLGRGYSRPKPRPRQATQLLGRKAPRSTLGGEEGLDFRLTQDVQTQLDQFQACPIQLEPLLDPIRIEHEDEEQRVGAPHVMNRMAAERWLQQSVQKTCPLCRCRVARLVSDSTAIGDLGETIRQLASESFQGGESLLHKAVKLLDAGLFAAAVRFLPGEESTKLVAKKNEAGQTPMDLLSVLHPLEKQHNFLEGLPKRQRGFPHFVHCPRSAAWGGSVFWCQEVPAFAGTKCAGPDGAHYTVLHFSQSPPPAPSTPSSPATAPGESVAVAGAADAAGETAGEAVGEAVGEAAGGARVEAQAETQATAAIGREAGRIERDDEDEDEWDDEDDDFFIEDDLPEPRKRPAKWGLVVCLRSGPGRDGLKEICTGPIYLNQVVGNGPQFDEEVFNPAIRICGGFTPQREVVFQGTLAARRGIWVGGTQHFDDFVVFGVDGASALVVFDPAENVWRLFPSDRQQLTVLIEPGSADCSDATANAEVSSSSAMGAVQSSTQPAARELAADEAGGVQAASAEWTVEAGASESADGQPNAPFPESVAEVAANTAEDNVNEVVPEVAGYAAEASDAAEAAETAEVAESAEAAKADEVAATTAEDDAAAKAVGANAEDTDAGVLAEAGEVADNAAAAADSSTEDTGAPQDTAEVGEASQQAAVGAQETIGGSSSSKCKASSPGKGSGSSEWRQVPAEGIAISKRGRTLMKIGSGNFVHLEPRYVAQRWSELAAADAMPPQPIQHAEARRLRENIAMVLLTSESNVHSDRSHMVALLSECSVGRSQACNVRFPQEVLTVSRCHCQMQLVRPGEDEGDLRDVPAKLVAYDDGSLCGTWLNNKKLGVGRAAAVPVNEGDVLRLGSESMVTVEAISSLLALHDNVGFAKFFERVGEKQTASTLLQEPRKTEYILSSSISNPHFRVAREMRGRYTESNLPAMRPVRRDRDFLGRLGLD